MAGAEVMLSLVHWLVRSHTSKPNHEEVVSSCSLEEGMGSGINQQPLPHYSVPRTLKRVWLLIGA